MDVDEPSLVERCENLMTAVVETRKQYGKKCIDYQHKTSRVANQLLQLRLDNIANYEKRKLPQFDIADMALNIEDIKAEMMEKQIRTENLCKRLNDTREVLLQVQNDNVTRKMQQPVTIQTLMKRAKTRHGGEM
ncbi:uncharacterized protein LOC134752229 [Cydia strobilella]|uniref:uncharacterized protein LOC134752229 n=1 Tax=Cydia strobilella TaxID=1100964 RepID=UPI0030049D7A